jgi:hypothetical protein
MYSRHFIKIPVYFGARNRFIVGQLTLSDFKIMRATQQNVSIHIGAK